MRKQQKLEEREHLVDQIEFYVTYIKTLQSAGASDDIIEENKRILADFRRRLQYLREGNYEEKVLRRLPARE